MPSFWNAQAQLAGSRLLVVGGGRRHDGQVGGDRQVLGCINIYNIHCLRVVNIYSYIMYIFVYMYMLNICQVSWVLFCYWLESSCCITCVRLYVDYDRCTYTDNIYIYMIIYVVYLSSNVSHYHSMLLIGISLCLAGWQECCVLDAFLTESSVVKIYTIA